MKNKYDVIIVGAGPAGLFAAYELVKYKYGRILLIDKGKSAAKRQTDEKLFGVGGGGLFSDGKLNLTPKRMKTDLTEFLPLSEADILINYIDKIFQKFGVKEETYPKNLTKARSIVSQAKENGINLLMIAEKHLGSDHLVKYIYAMEKFLKKNKVDFLLENEVIKTKQLRKSEFLLHLKSGTNILTKKVIFAPGRTGNKWLKDQLAKLGIQSVQGAIEIGIRVEVPASVLQEITSIFYDPPIFITTPSYDDLLETFCTCPGGFVVRENYDGFACINGYSNKGNHSANSNFALLNKISLTQPVTDTIAYGESICRLISTIGGGKPIIQRLSDFKRHRRSTWLRIGKGYVEPTLKDVTPGDIGMAFPHRMVVNLVEALERLNTIIPGVNSDSTLLYAPEVKFFSVRPEIDKNLQTKIKGLFVAGDGAGVSGNIVGAAATGIIAARGIISSI
jgi:uncharacterized FAD-dependent dehydrogenase